MSAKHETGGTEATEAEAAALLSISFAERTGDAVRALRAYASAAEALARSVGRREGLADAVSELQRLADNIDDDVVANNKGDPELAHHLRGVQLVLRRAAQRLRGLAEDGPKANV